jgi:hypothetical protein
MSGHQLLGELCRPVEAFTLIDLAGGVSVWLAVSECAENPLKAGFPNYSFVRSE